MPEKTVEQIAQELNEKFDKLNDKIEAKAAKPELETLKNEILEGMKKLPQSDQFEKMQDHLDEMDVKIQKIRVGEPSGKSILDQIGEWLKGDGYKKAAESFKANKPVNYGAEMKTGEITGSTFTETNGAIIQRLYDPEIAVDPRRANSVYDLMTKSSIDSDAVQTIERTTETGNAEQVAEAVAPASKSTLAWTSYHYHVVDLAEYMKVSRNKLDDTAFVRSEVMEMLMNNIPELREQALLTGYDATANLLGLINTSAQVAKDFAKPTGFTAVDSANNLDVLRAAILQVRIGNAASVTRAKGFNANAILLNPVDMANLDLQKSSVDGHYVLPPFVSADRTTIKGVPVVESDWLTAGKFLVGDFSKTKIYQRKNLEINMYEQNDTDAIARLVTFTAVLRYIFVTKAKYAFAYCYGDFSTAKGMIS
jgi:HK97 family phage major capsid protein